MASDVGNASISMDEVNKIFFEWDQRLGRVLFPMRSEECRQRFDQYYYSTAYALYCLDHQRVTQALDALGRSINPCYLYDEQSPINNKDALRRLLVHELRRFSKYHEIYSVHVRKKERVCEELVPEHHHFGAAYLDKLSQHFYRPRNKKQVATYLQSESIQKKIKQYHRFNVSRIYMPEHLPHHQKSDLPLGQYVASEMKTYHQALSNSLSKDILKRTDDLANTASIHQAGVNFVQIMRDQFDVSFSCEEREHFAKIFDQSMTPREKSYLLHEIEKRRLEKPRYPPLFHTQSPRNKTSLTPGFSPILETIELDTNNHGYARCEKRKAINEVMQGLTHMRIYEHVRSKDRKNTVPSELEVLSGAVERHRNIRCLEEFDRYYYALSVLLYALDHGKKDGVVKSLQRYMPKCFQEWSEEKSVDLRTFILNELLRYTQYQNIFAKQSNSSSLSLGMCGTYLGRLSGLVWPKQALYVLGFNFYVPDMKKEVLSHLEGVEVRTFIEDKYDDIHRLYIPKQLAPRNRTTRRFVAKDEIDLYDDEVKANLSRMARYRIYHLSHRGEGKKGFLD